MDFALFDQRPIVVALAGPNGAGKTTFYHAHLADAGLRFVNADVIADELGADPYQAAGMADALRRQLLSARESFIMETVFSDPVGDKVAFLEDAARQGYTVVLCYIGLADAAQSMQRVAMRVSQGGHEVPDDKLAGRFVRSLNNLKLSIARLPHVLVFDNSDLRRSFSLVAVYEHGQLSQRSEQVPEWMGTILR